MTGGGGGGSAFDATAGAIFLLVSIGSGFITCGCDMTTGCGGGAAGVFIIGLICVDPTFIVGALAGDCCIVLITAAVFNILAVTESKPIECGVQHNINVNIRINISLLCCTTCAPFSITDCRI